MSAFSSSSSLVLAVATPSSKIAVSMPCVSLQHVSWLKQMSKKVNWWQIWSKHDVNAVINSKLAMNRWKDELARTEGWLHLYVATTCSNPAKFRSMLHSWRHSLCRACQLGCLRGAPQGAQTCLNVWQTCRGGRWRAHIKFCRGQRRHCRAIARRIVSPAAAPMMLEALRL